MQTPDFLLDLVLILLFPTIFDWSRTIAKMVLIKLKTRKQDSEKNPYFRVHDKKISILIPAHNEESCIRESIEAALATFYPNREIIVIDDCSTDKTYTIAKEYADNGLIRLLYRKTGGSKAEALNHGYLHSNGEIIVTTDADTKLGVHSLEHVIRNFDDKDVMVVSGNISISGGDGNVNNLLTDLQKYEYQHIFEIGKVFSSLLGTLLLAAGAFSAFRRDAINWEGRFRKETLGEDFDKSIKIKKMGKKIVHVKEAIAHTHCPNNFDALKRQRNRWASGQMTTILQHRAVLFLLFIQHQIQACTIGHGDYGCGVKPCRNCHDDAFVCGNHHFSCCTSRSFISRVHCIQIVFSDCNLHNIGGYLDFVLSKPCNKANLAENN